MCFGRVIRICEYLDRVCGGTSALATGLQRRRQREQNQMHPVDLNISRRSSCVYPSHKKLAAVNLKANVFSLFRSAGGIIQGYGQKQSFQDT